MRIKRGPCNHPVTSPVGFASPYRILQAVVIISVLLQFLNKIDRQDLKSAVWKGAFMGLFGAIAIGVGFIIAFYETNEQFFTGNTEYVVEAILVSSVYLVWLQLHLALKEICHT